MSAQIDLLRQEITSLEAQMKAPKGDNEVMSLLRDAKGLLKLRESTGETPNRARVEGLMNAIAAKAAAYNSAAVVTVPDVTEILADYDALAPVE